jgi:3-deoxy-D-manno-octulosonate 8-phosphate phosphatase (KDO 8-P phosphatase)
LKIKDVYQGVNDKSGLCRRLRQERRLGKEEICCIGDDLPDLAMFREAGLRMAVADAVKEVRESADVVLSQKGGLGAVREACEWLLRKQGKWQRVLTGLGGKGRSK